MTPVQETDGAAESCSGIGSQWSSSPSAMPVHTICTRPTLRIDCGSRSGLRVYQYSASDASGADERDAIARLPISPRRLARD